MLDRDPGARQSMDAQPDGAKATFTNHPTEGIITHDLELGGV